MNTRLVLTVSIALLIGGCASDWPHTHHLAAPKTTANCTPTGSRIARQGCNISNPSSSTTQDEYDRQGLGAGGSALVPPGQMAQIPR